MNRFKVGDNVIDDNQKSWSMPELAKQKNKRQIVEHVMGGRVYLDSGIGPKSIYAKNCQLISNSNILDSYYSI